MTNDEIMDALFHQSHNKESETPSIFSLLETKTETDDSERKTSATYDDDDLGFLMPKKDKFRLMNLR